MADTKAQRINWETIFALAALDAAVIISWTAYHDFQPKLIAHFHFEHLERFVLVVQSIVILTVPLLAGWLTDYYRRTSGSNFSVFAVGISVASMIFMAVAFTISDQAFVNLIWLLPVLIIFWLISMNVFHSPANSILEAFSKSPELPLMMAVLTLAKVLIHGIKPILLKTLNDVGGSATFVIGGLILIVTGLWFSRSTKSITIAHHEGESDPDRFHLVVLFGAVTGLCNTLILHFFPSILEARFGHSSTVFSGHLYISLVLGGAACFTFPATRIVKTVGIYRSLLWGLIIAFGSMILVLLFHSIAGVAIASFFLAVGYSIMLITGFPYALLNISARNATFGTGLFFASFELFEVLVGLFMHH